MEVSQPSPPASLPLSSFGKHRDARHPLKPRRSTGVRDRPGVVDRPGACRREAAPSRPTTPRRCRRASPCSRSTSARSWSSTASTATAARRPRGTSTSPTASRWSTAARSRGARRRASSSPLISHAEEPHMPQKAPEAPRRRHRRDRAAGSTWAPLRPAAGRAREGRSPVATAVDRRGPRLLVVPAARRPSRRRRSRTARGSTTPVDRFILAALDAKRADARTRRPTAAP